MIQTEIMRIKLLYPVLSLVLLTITGFLSAQPTDISSLKSSGSLGACQIAISNCRFTRQIGIGIKTFEPLHAKIDITFNNSSAKTIILKHLCYLYDSNNKKYLLTCGIQRGDLEPIPWSGEITGAGEKRITLSAWDGPQLEAGAKVFVVINFYDDQGNSLWLTSAEGIVKGKPHHRSDSLPQNDIFNQIEE